MEIENAVDAALDEMSADFEIKGFLFENRAEVKSMCITEYDEEETMEMFREEGREEGRAEGRAEGQEEADRIAVDLCKDLGGSSMDAIAKIMANMKLSKAEADHLVMKYW